MWVTKMATQRECLRWAVNSSNWKPTASVSRYNHSALAILICSQEWCTAMSCVQDEERERINKFVFAQDATHALVSHWPSVCASEGMAAHIVGIVL